MTQQSNKSKKSKKYSDAYYEVVEGFAALTLEPEHFLMPALTETRQFLDALDRVPPPEEVSYEASTIDNVVCEIQTPTNCSSNQVILYFHGGGFCISSPLTHRNISVRLAIGMQCKAISVDYRLAPEHPFPAAIDDCYAVYCHAVEQYGASNIAIGGDSAGGNLVANVLLRAKHEGVAQPAAAIMMSPWLDLQNQSKSMSTKAEKDVMLSQEILNAFAQNYSAHQAPYGSVALDADFSGLANVLIQVGSAEVLLDDSLHLEEQLKKAQVDVELDVADDMWHVWQSYAGYVPEADVAVAKCVDFLTKHLTN